MCVYELVNLARSLSFCNSCIRKHLINHEDDGSRNLIVDPQGFSQGRPLKRLQNLCSSITA